MKTPRCFRLLTAGLVLCGWTVAAVVSAAEPTPEFLAAAAQDLFKAKCFRCHGQDREKLRGAVDVTDHQLLVDPRRKLVVPGDPEASEVIRRVTKGEMPKGGPPLAAAEQTLLRTWITAGAPASFPADLPPGESFPSGSVNPGTLPQPVPPPATFTLPGLPASQPVPAAQSLPAQVNVIFTRHCFKCHGKDPDDIGGEIRINDIQALLKNKKLIPGKPNDSPLFKLVSSKSSDRMPPEDQPALPDADIETIRQWIAAGALPYDPTRLHEAQTVLLLPEKIEETKFQGSLGAEYTLKSILTDVLRLKAEERRYARYFSLTHILNGGATKEELTQQRQALFKAVNHLTWSSKLVLLKPVENTHTVFRVDLRELGWDQPIYTKSSTDYASFNLFDLVLLEYPYGIIYNDKSNAYLGLLREYFPHAQLVRPIAYVRSDWFVATATQPPLYHDLLQLPLKVEKLESRLGVSAKQNVADYRAQRAGMTDSQVSRNNRVVERHPSKYGAYWKSFDFKTSQDQENMLKDPLVLHPTGGEMVFSLPNGLHGYYVADATDNRIDSAPTDIVVDKNASDRIVRNGLSCMRCHTDGIKTFRDVVRPIVKQLPGSPGFSIRDVLRMYPDQVLMDKLLADDTKRFMTALEQTLGTPQTVEPLTPVSTRFLDKSIDLSQASAEIGLPDSKSLLGIFLLPQFARLGLSPLGVNRTVHRDVWQDYYDRVVRQLGLGVPIVPLDALTELNYEPSFPPPFELTVKTSRPSNQYSPGDKLALTIKATRDVYLELIATGPDGVKEILLPATTRLKANEDFKYPNAKKEINIRNSPGKLLLTLYASTTPFPDGKVLKAEGVADRLAHPFLIKPQGKKVTVTFSPDPLTTVKRTVELEVR